MRFTKQRTSYDCGPVAIANSFKWAGKRFDYISKHKQIMTYFKVKENKGVHRHLFHDFLTKKKFPFSIVKIKRNITAAYMKAHIKANQAIILGIELGGFAHVMLAIQINNKNITLINWKNKTINKVRLSQFNKYLNKYSIGYIIKK